MNWLRADRRTIRQERSTRARPPVRLSAMISTRNQIPGRVKSILSDKVVSEVIVETAAGPLASVITTASVKAMKLKKGDQVFVLVKATEAGLQKAP